MESAYKIIKLMGLRAEGGWVCIDSIHYDSSDSFFDDYKFLPREIREQIIAYYENTDQIKQISFNNTVFDPSGFIALKCYIE